MSTPSLIRFEVPLAIIRGFFVQGFFTLFLLFFLFLSSQVMCAKGEEKGSGVHSAFSSTEVKIQVEPGKHSFVAEWLYTNSKEFPMVVEHIDSSCGCLAAKVSDYQPVNQGESGRITAEFKPGNHRGVLRKSMHVRFAGYDKPVELVVEAHIPSPVELSTQELTWTEENKDKRQVVEVTTGTATDFQITDLLGVPESLFSIEQETIVENRHYRLSITPTGKAAPGIQTLQVRTDSRDPRYQVIAVFLRPPNS